MNNFFDEDFDFSELLKFLPMLKDMEKGPFAGFRPMGFVPFMPPMFYMQQMAFNNTMQMMKNFIEKCKELQEKYSSDNTQTMDLGGIKVPAELFRKLLSIEMSPENLEKLQGALDFFFGMMDTKKANK